MEIAEIQLGKLHCPTCALKLEQGVRELEGVGQVQLNFNAGRLIVHYDPAIIERSTLVAAVKRAGYSTAHEDKKGFWRDPELVLTALSGLLLAGGLGISLSLFGPDPVLLRPFSLSAILYLGSILAGGYYILRRGWAAVRARSLNIDFLVSIAVLGAVGIGEFFEAASLVFLFSVAEILEDWAADRARGSLKELMELAPTIARVRRDGREELVPVEELRVGELILVKPGERISMDGVVEAESSTVNQAPITGESLPVHKSRGDQVFAGTINIDGFLEIRVTKLVQDSTLAKIIRLVEEAEAEKAPTEQFVERFARYYTPTVVGAAIAVAAIPPLFLAQEITGWFLKAITLLVIACPCALVISTPVSVVSAITGAARRGVLIKGGIHLENMGRVRAIGIDKTGTLTLGQPQVTDVVPLNDHSEEELLGIAAALERRSEHPLAEAIVRAAEERQLRLEDVEDFQALAGRGVRAKLNGRTYYVGKPALFADLGLDQLKLADDHLIKLQEEGKTAVLVGTERELCGIIALADRPRPGAREAIQRLRELGVKVVMLTGDNPRTAKAIAEELGIGAERVRAELLPEEKIEEIKRLTDQFGTVAMVGDGVNDAPALAAATVGIAMGVAGTDAALETADIALMADDLGKLPYLVELGRKARWVIKENIWASILIKLALSAGVFPGVVTLALAVLVGDMGATLGVTANALRLARVR